MKKYGLLLLSLFFIVKCQVVPLIKIAKTTGAVKSEIVTTQEVAKLFEGTAETTKATVDVVKRVIKTVKEVQKPIAVVTAMTKEREKPLDEMTEEELFAKMFGAQSASPTVKDLVVPMIVNTRYGRKTKLNIIRGKSYVGREDLERTLEEFVREDVLAQIFDGKYINPNGVDLESLEKFGIAAYFDESDLSVKINIAPTIVKKHSYTLSPIQRMSEKNFQKIMATKSEPISGASNFYLRDSFSSTDNGATLIRSAATLRNNTFVNLYDYIVETGAAVTEQLGAVKVNAVNRDYTRVSRDFPQSNHRLKVGDVALENFDKMSTKNILGVSLLKHYDITKRMHQSIRVSSREIFLENESRLQIYINDRLIRTLDLEPGTHQIDDFPFTTGLNNVKIKITDILGNEKIIDFDEFSFSEMLRKDVSTYGVSVGINSERLADASIRYYPDKPILSAYYNYGINDSLTLKSGVQLNDTVGAYGGELLLASNLGLVSLYGILSNTKNIGLGRKYGVAYKHVIKGVSLNIKKETVDSLYKEVGSDVALNKASESMLGTLSSSFFGLGYLSLQYLESRTALSSSTSYGLAYSYNLTREWDIRTTYRQDYTNGIENKEASILLSYRPTGSNVAAQTTVTYSDPIVSRRYEASINRKSRYGLDGLYSYLDTGNGQSVQTMRSSYLHSDYSLNADYTDISNSTNTLSKQGSLSMATGIAFVGTEAAMTQPISNSFIIVKNDKSLADNPLGVINYNENEPSRSVVIPMGDYATKQLKISDKNLIFGAELVENKYSIASKYKSGKLIKIKPKFVLSAKGRLLSQEKKTLDRKVFKLYKVKDGGVLEKIAQDDIFFTNGNGKFILGAVEEGSYKAKEINVDDPYEFTFTIEPGNNEVGFVNLGDIVVSKRRGPSAHPDG